MKHVFCAIAVLISVVGFSQTQQDHKLSHRKKPPVASAASGAVTEAEARAVFAKVARAFRSITDRGIQGPPSAIGNSSMPVTRSLVLQEMNRLYLWTKPYFKFTPKNTYYDPSLFTIHTGNPLRPTLEMLVRQGFVGRVSPLATSNVETLTVPQFGDAVGIFVARTADLTHMPSAKYSPTLSGQQ
jgi:hypothetical protein